MLFCATPLVGELPRSNGQTTAWPAAPSRALRVIDKVNAGEYWIKGKGQMTVFNTGPNAVTMDFNAGDVGYVKKNLGHYIKNTGDTDLQFLEVFRAPYFADVSLSDWIARTPPAMVAQHLNVSEATIAKFPKTKPEVMPV